MVGCNLCQFWCIYDAIIFSDPKRVKDFIKENKILVLAKKELEEKYGL